MYKMIIMLSLLLLPCSYLHARSLEKMSEKLVKTLSDFKNPKVAVLEIEPGEGVEKEDVKVLYLRFVGVLAGMKKVTLIERAQLDKVLNEMKLQASGAFASGNIQRLGELSGADFVVLSAVNKLKSDRFEINSRIVQAATGKVIGADKSEVKKDWGLREKEIVGEPRRSKEEYLKNINQWTAQIAERKNLGLGVHSSAYYGRGLSYYAVADYNSAAVDFSRAIAAGNLEYPDSSWANYLLGKSNFLQKKYSEAILPLKTALDLSVPSSLVLDTYTLLVACYAYVDNYADSAKYATEALKLFPKEWRLWLARGGSNFQLSDYDNAIIDIRRAIDFGFDVNHAENMLAWIYFDKGDYPKSLEYFRKQVLVTPSSPDAYAGLALISYKTEKIHEAGNHYKTAIRYDPQFAGAFDRLKTDYQYTNLEIAAMKELYLKLGDPKR